MDLSVTENATLASLERFSPFGISFLGRAAERAAALDVTRLLRLRAPSLDAPVSALSGGNQQKVYLARLLIAEPKILLLDEPTRGVDIAAKADIYEFIRGLAAKGVSVVFASSEMEELLGLAHRILVLHRGAIVLEEPRASEATRERLLKAAMGQASTNTQKFGEEGA
jgi:ABC-type sugar transport system ATPase subunit